MEKIQSATAEDLERRKRYDEIINTNLLSDARKRTKQSIWVLAAVGVINVLFTLWYYFGEQNPMAAIIQGIIALVFFGLTAFAFRQPYKAILSGTIFYVLLIGILAAFDITTLFQGIVIKIFIVAALVKGIKAAKEAKELEMKLAPSQSELAEPK